MIVANNISKNYAPDFMALKDVSFTIKDSTIAGVIGRNGAGKSTLFKIMAGVISNYSGVCTINENAVSLDYSEKVSYLPETRGLDGRSQVLEHLTDMVRYKGIKKKAAEAYVKDWLSKFNLESAKYKRIDTLSKGNQQKLQFIIAVASKPEILILDEPFSGLDPITSDLFWVHLEELKNNGCTVIFSTHNLSDKMRKCDQFLFIKQGKLVENGSLETIQKKYDFILELKNESFSPELVKDLVASSNILRNQNTYVIRISTVETAKEIQSRLQDSFSEYFHIRNMTLDELFREINYEDGD
ncbi:MAG: ATP-binding cassette domain-containing protein [Mobilitalea sp.]